MRTNERYTRNREAGNKNENKSTMHNNMCFLSFGVFICRLVCLSVHLFDSLFAHMNCGGRKMSEVSWWSTTIIGQPNLSCGFAQCTHTHLYLVEISGKYDRHWNIPAIIHLYVYITDTCPHKPWSPQDRKWILILMPFLCTQFDKSFVFERWANLRKV